MALLAPEAPITISLTMDRQYQAICNRNPETSLP
jgi:hypothetical protein